MNYVPGLYLFGCACGYTYSYDPDDEAAAKCPECGEALPPAMEDDNEE